jgi:hypothetical protein
MEQRAGTQQQRENNKTTRADNRGKQERTEERNWRERRETHNNAQRDTFLAPRRHMYPLIPLDVDEFA